MKRVENYMKNGLNGSNMDLSASPALLLDTFNLQVNSLSVCQFLS